MNIVVHYQLSKEKLWRCRNQFTKGCNNNGCCNKESSTRRVLMFPWVAHGHITPFLDLAKKLSQRNFTIFLCSTPINLDSVRNKLDEKYACSIQLIELHLEATEDFPPQFHTTNGLPKNLMCTLKNALEKACPDFVTILKDLEPDVLLHDFLQPWAGEAAKELGIPAIDFISSSATQTSIMYHVFQTKQGSDYPLWSHIMHFRDYDQDGLKNLEATSKRRNIDDMRAIHSIDQSTDIVLIKSFKEIEGKYCEYLSKLSNKKFVPVGPLVQEHVILDDTHKKSPILEWLDQKKQGSTTVFVSFGTEYFLSKAEIEDVSHGLEQSKVNFVWVLRAPKGEVMNLDDVLPEGFLKRVGDRGLVVDCWAPQAQILEHESIGGFVSHCGWNSVIEAMTFGVPIIAMPMHIDQPINARLAEEIGMGLEVARDGNRRFQSDEMVAIIDRVMTNASFRKKVRDMSDLIRSKGDEEIDAVAVELNKMCMKKGLPII